MKLSTLKNSQTINDSSELPTLMRLRYSLMTKHHVSIECLCIIQAVANEDMSYKDILCNKMGLEYTSKQSTEFIRDNIRNNHIYFLVTYKKGRSVVSLSEHGMSVYEDLCTIIPRGGFVY